MAYLSRTNADPGASPYSWWAFLFLIPAAVFAGFTLFLLPRPINGVAYTLGKGEEVTVLVTKAERSGRRHRWEGRGFYVANGQRHAVKFTGRARVGTRVKARTTFIDAGWPRSDPNVYLEQAGSGADIASTLRLALIAATTLGFALVGTSPIYVKILQRRRRSSRTD